GEAHVRNVHIAAEDLAGLVRLASAERIDLTIIGPEAPLVMGVVDAFAAAGLPCFGPRRTCAQLEGSKAFAKEFLRRHGIPTARTSCRSRAPRTTSVSVMATADPIRAAWVLTRPRRSSRPPCTRA